MRCECVIELPPAGVDEDDGIFFQFICGSKALLDEVVACTTDGVSIMRNKQ